MQDTSIGAQVVRPTMSGPLNLTQLDPKIFRIWVWAASEGRKFST
jgi:hypothetical protein